MQSRRPYSSSFRWLVNSGYNGMNNYHESFLSFHLYSDSGIVKSKVVSVPRIVNDHKLIIHAFREVRRRTLITCLFV